MQVVEKMVTRTELTSNFTGGLSVSIRLIKEFVRFRLLFSTAGRFHLLLLRVDRNVLVLNVEPQPVVNADVLIGDPHHGKK